MNFLADIATEVGSNFVSDGLRTLPYAEMRQGHAWNTWLERHGVSRAECVGLETRTDARSAAAVLALLDRGQSFLLWRQPIAVDRDGLVPGALPPFCRAAIVVSKDGSAQGEPASGPDGFRLVRSKADASDPVDVGGSYVYLPTSGTTGKPKIVAYEAGALWANAGNCAGRLQLKPADRVMIPVPLAHMYGLGAAFLPAVLAGASIRLIPEANLLTYLQAEAEFGPTTTFLTPSFCHLLVKGRKQARPYRLTILAGDAADPKTFAAYEQRHGCTISLFGSTELGAISAGSPDDPFIERRDSAGTPLSDVRVATVRGKTSLLGAAQPFPLRVDHPYGCAGYADRKGRPVKRPSLYRRGWYYTRDMGRIDERGRIQLAGRFDDAVKRDGFLVTLADVERALLRIDDIECAVVVPAGMTPRGRELVAFCKVSHRRFDCVLLRRLALEHLPGHAVPDRFIFLEEMPLTATAKPDRRALAAMASYSKERASDAHPE